MSGTWPFLGDSPEKTCWGSTGKKKKHHFFGINLERLDYTYIIYIITQIFYTYIYIYVHDTHIQYRTCNQLIHVGHKGAAWHVECFFWKTNLGGRWCLQRSYAVLLMMTPCEEKRQRCLYRILNIQKMLRQTLPVSSIWFVSPYKATFRLHSSFWTDQTSTSLCSQMCAESVAGIYLETGSFILTVETAHRSELR